MAVKLNDTDLLFLQRVDTSNPVPEHYYVAINQLTEYVGDNINVIISNLSTEVDLIKAEVLAINTSLAQIVTEVRLLQLEDVQINQKLTTHDEQILKNQTDIEQIKTRAKVDLRYKWLETLEDDNPDNLASGEMYAVFDNDDNITNLYYSTTDPDGIPTNQPFVFAGETLELTSAFDPVPDQPSKLRYRSVLLLDDITIFTNYIELDVSQIHEFGDLPYYVDDVNPIITRTDFHPNSLNVEVLAEQVEANYLKLNGTSTMTGNLTMNRGTNSSNINLISTNESVLNASTKLRITVNNSYRMLFDSTGVNFNAPIDAGGNKITNLGTPTADTDAVTKSYLDDELLNLEAEIAEKFEPGEQVAKASSSGVETGGFYMTGGTLYVKL